MREIVVPVILVVAAVGVMAWWTMKGDLLRPSETTNAIAPAPVEEPKPAPAAAYTKAKRQPIASASSKQAADSLPPVADPASVAVVAADPATALTTSPFPTAEEIHSGAQGEKIVERYGNPALSATTCDHDHVLETFVYARDHGQLQTVIRIEDGKVLNAYSQSTPPVNAFPPNMRVRH
jgi:hypothetical protein